MKRGLILLLMGVWVMAAQAQVDRWGEVARLEQESLPASALEVVNRIYQDALERGDTPMLIKALIHRLKYETAIDKDVLPDRIRDIESFAEKEKDPVGQAVLYSLLAELYADYYFSREYTIVRRTDILGDAPEDLREWSANLFREKVAELTYRSFAPESELQRTKIGVYWNILTGGRALLELCPTLYDFVLHQGIQTLSRFNLEAWYPGIMGLYAQWLIFRFKQEDATEASRRAYLMVELEQAEFIYQNAPSGDRDAEYIQLLSDLERRYAGQALCVEILYREADYYRRHTSDDPENPYENIRKAYTLCVDGIKAYPSYARIGLLQNLLSELTKSQLFVTSDNAVYPGKELTLRLRYRNVQRLTIAIYGIHAPVSIYSGWQRGGQYPSAGRLIETRSVDLNDVVPYQEADTLLRIPMKDMGCYEYVISDGRGAMEPLNRRFSVSRLGTVARVIDGKTEYLVVDRMSGKPIQKAQIRLYTEEGRKNVLSQTLLTDANGMAVTEGKDFTAYVAVFQNDTSLVLSSTPWVSDYRKPSSAAARLTLFTDRGIYRPGQTVYFKGIAFEAGTAVVADKTYTLFFRDANGKEIANKQLKTNAFGSLAGEFLIPKGGLNGAFSISSNTDRGYVNVRVEEYKRPTFDIQFDPNDAAYRFGDTLTVAGSAKTFSGVQLQDREVRYKVTRQHHWLFRIFYAAPVLVAEGSVQTQSDGRFTLRFPADKAVKDRNRSNVFYTYSIEATLTAPNGETQTSITRLSVGDKSMYLNVSGLSDVLQKESMPASIAIDAFNLSGHPVSAQGFYEIYSLKKIDDTLLYRDDYTNGEEDAEDWMPVKRISRQAFEAGQDLDSNAFRSLPSGRYRLIAKVLDSHGNEVETEVDFTLASAADKRPPMPVYEWVIEKKTTCAVGEKAQIVYGSSAKDVHVLFELFKDNKKLASSRFVLNNENRTIEIPFLESYGDGITASFLFIKDEQDFATNVSLYKKQADKTLSLQMETFRDRLLPGQAEQWTLSIRDAEQKPVAAELLAAMYDASLDKLYPHRWSFNPVPPIPLWTPYNAYGVAFSHSYDNVYENFASAIVPEIGYVGFNWFGFEFSSNSLLNGRMAGVASRASDQKIRVRGASANNDPDSSPIELKETVQFASLTTVDEEVEDDAAAPPLRQNFNETAFFFPQLKTDKDGQTLLSFTVPESNTTWNFTGLAHTPDLRFGQIAKQVISQKQLMVTPNIPRFLRAGDHASLLASISNLSEQTLDGKATLELFDPATDQTVIEIPNRSLPFSLQSGQTRPVSWSFDVPDSLEIVGIRISAASNDFSDGEQHLLPILPNRMLVTESLSLDMKGQETRTFPLAPLFDKTSDTMEDYRTTLELTGNPTWYAIQALPSLDAPQTDDVLAWFAAYYMNTMAARIANGSPAIRSAITRWNQAFGDAETLLSPLEKNEELKAILLEETPWVLEAENESAQYRRLANLFDPNRLSYGEAQALEKLQSLQTGDGGWAWYPGLPSSLGITHWILYGMASLRPDSIDEMTEKALLFIDTRFQRHFEQFKKDKPRWNESQSISIYELEYLLVRSSYPNRPADVTAEAIAFYTGLLAKHWNKISNLYQRAIAASILHRNEQTKAAQAILRSLREHATKRPDLGMYWANNHTSSFMTQSAVCTHTFIMQAFREVGSTPAEMDDMKRWLLKQKQTQRWESAPATVNAIDILLQTGGNWLESPGHITASLDRQPLPLPASEAATAYLKAPQDPAAFQAAHTLTLAKHDDGPAWGALYRQYFEDIDRLAPAVGAGAGLSISKALLAPTDRPLQVGDEITIQLTVRTDRDLEFVHLKDLRAACLEPADPLSGLQWQQGLLFYQSPKDASMNFFFSSLPKGVYVFEYRAYVAAKGDYSNGIASIQCLYAPSFAAHTAGERVQVE